jgi:hypothetical protein
MDKSRPLGLLVATASAALLLNMQAQASDPFNSLEYVSEYGATIGPEDRVSSTGTKLSKPGAILQQDRFNVNVRGTIQPGDSRDDYFVSNARRAEMAKAEVVFLGPEAEAHFINGTYPLLVEALRRMGDGKLMLYVSMSDGEPANDPDADAVDISLPAAAIPDPFHGRWGASQEACTTGGTLEILTIDARGLHKAGGEILATSLMPDAQNPSRISFAAQNTGGGEAWPSTEEFVLSRDAMILAWRQLKPARSAMTELFRCGQP